MKRLLHLTVIVIGIIALSQSKAFSWIFIDTSNAPAIPMQGILDATYDIDRVLSRNFRNYPAAFALANVGGYPIGDATLGDFPHMFFGVSFTVGCANMRYYNEDWPREKSVYPAYAPNPALNLGFGIGKGFDILFKIMIFSDAIYRPALNQESAKLSKFNIYSGGFKLRKNIFGKIAVLPNLFNFGGFTVSAGADYMEGILAINGHYKYTLNNVFIGPGPTDYYNIDFDAYYNFNLKWLMLAVNAQAIVYVNLLYFFDLYAGFGLAVTYGYNKLDGSGVGTITNISLGNLGIINAKAEYHKRPRSFMGLFIGGLEINILILKITAETIVNITNGNDINLQLGTRFQF